MKKTKQKYPKTILIKKYSLKRKIKNILKLIFLFFSITICTILLSFAFGIGLFKCNYGFNAATDYYVVFTTTEQNTYDSSFELAQQLKTRGAGGNIFEKNNNYWIIISVYADNKKAKTVIENLNEQNLTCNCTNMTIKADGMHLANDNQTIIKELYNLNIYTINNLLTLVENLDKQKTTNIDARITIFSLYTQYQNTLEKHQNKKDKTVQSYLNKMINVQSLLYLLSHENKDNVCDFTSIIRNYIFRMLQELK